MRVSRKASRSIAIGAVATVLVAVVSATLFVHGAASANTNVVQQLRPHQVKVQPLMRQTKQVKGAAVPRFGCQDVTSGQPLCYNPQQIRTAYGIQSVLNSKITGKNRTIAIVDAFDNPYIQSDLNIFDSTFGLPNKTIDIEYPLGHTAFNYSDDDMVGWSGEIALDVQWAHAVAPDANILLALSPSDLDTDLLATTQWIVDNNKADVISQSFGEAESCVDPNLLKQQHALFKEATQKNITLVASSGDDGASQLACDGNSFIVSASSPASDPLVLSVGGTNLKAGTTSGTYSSEHAWADNFSGCPYPSQGCSGGGFSTIYGRPFYQVGVHGTFAGERGVPDVSYNAGVDGGVLTHWGVGLVLNGISPTDNTIFFIYGGTSAGSPQWAGIAALADQAANRDLGFINAAIYRGNQVSGLYSANFHDITSGSNALDPVGGYNAAVGWDPVTGWGSPKANAEVSTLAVETYATDGQSAINNNDGHHRGD